MTESEWLAGADAYSLLEHVRGQASDRQLRLFACACMRRIWHLLPVDASRRCVEVTELYADGVVGERDLTDSIHTSMQACEEERHRRQTTGGTWTMAESYALNAVSRVHRRHSWEPTIGHSASAWAADEMAKGRSLPARMDRPEAQLDRLRKAETARQTSLLRDIVGNPFRPVGFDLAWRTADAVAIARRIYDTQDFGPMPILSDALMDAGCDSKEILAHCRTDEPHVRGCFVVDLVLGKE